MGTTTKMTLLVGKAEGKRKECSRLSFQLLVSRLFTSASAEND
jgi:hypothetical protein